MTNSNETTPNTSTETPQNSQESQNRLPLQNEPQVEQQAPVSRPEETIRDGNLKATIWRREGNDHDYFTTDFAKTYEDQNGQLKDTRSFYGTELLRVSELARNAHHRNAELRREEIQDRYADNRAKRAEQKRSKNMSYDR